MRTFGERAVFFTRANRVPNNRVETDAHGGPFDNCIYRKPIDADTAYVDFFHNLSRKRFDRYLDVRIRKVLIGLSRILYNLTVYIQSTVSYKLCTLRIYTVSLRVILCILYIYIYMNRIIGLTTEAAESLMPISNIYIVGP